MANSHPGGYCGQDAYNGMLVTDGLRSRKRTVTSDPLAGQCGRAELHARPANNFEGGAADK